MSNEPEVGVTFTISLPLTLAVLEGMTVGVGDERYVLPLSNVVEAFNVESGLIHYLPDRSRVVSCRGDYLPLLSIRRAFNFPTQTDECEDLAIIVDTETNGHIALLIDELIGQSQVVLKSLEPNYQHVDGVAGATILGDGRVALILDVPYLTAAGSKITRSEKEMLH